MIDQSSPAPLLRWLSRQSRQRLTALIAVFALSVASIIGVVAQSGSPSGPAGPSPATRHAAVIAQGVIAVPDGEAVWNVSARTADAAQGPVTLDASGFVVATRSPILVIDPANDAKTRLAAGEALFVREGQTLAFESFGAPERYVFIALQAADAEPASGDSIYASATFAGDGIERDVDLIRDVLASGEQSLIQSGAVPLLLFVTQGEVSVTTADGNVKLSAGTAQIFNGAVTIAGGADGASWVAAYVGTSLGDGTPQVAGATPRTTPAPATPEATIEPTVEPTEELATLVPQGTPDASPEASPAAEDVDTDEDGIPDAGEIAIGTDPENLDSDGDLLYDGGELIYEVNPLNPDSDNDGLTDGEEVYFTETDPANADSDGDGTNDYNEVVNGTDPNDAGTGAVGGDPDLDTDSDGLTAVREALAGTDPTNGDTDGDGVNDSNEVDAGTDPLDINSWP